MLTKSRQLSIAFRSSHIRMFVFLYTENGNFILKQRFFAAKFRPILRLQKKANFQCPQIEFLL